MKRKIAILLALSLLMMPITATAAECLWQLSEDGKLLTHEGVEYHRYYLDLADRFMPMQVLVLDETGAFKIDAEEYCIHQSDSTDEIVAVVAQFDWYGDEWIYVTETGREILDRFTVGQYGSVLLMDAYLMDTAQMTLAELETLDALEKNEDVDVTELASADCYEIIGMDETLTVGHKHGAVYSTSYGYFYVNYDALDNSYFSSDGEFSFRSGSVEAVRLDGEAAQMVADLLANMNYREEWYSYESDNDDAYLEPEDAMSAFWILTVILGVILPAVPLTFGLIYALRGKCLYPKRWYALVALAVAWMLTVGAIVLLIVR